MAKAPFAIPVGSVSPSFTFSEVTEDPDVDFTTADVRFRMRREDSSVMLVDAAGTLLPTTTRSRADMAYVQSPSDVASEGVFRAWWTIDVGAGPIDTEEYSVVVYAHAQGFGVRTGAVATAARSELPVDWDALTAYSGYGDVQHQRRVEVVKLSVIGAGLSAQDEAALDPRIVDYLAKIVAMQTCEPAISYWRDQIVSQSSRGGGSEVQTFPDRIASLEKTKVRLATAIAVLRPTIDPLLPTGAATVGDAPMVDTVGGLITPGLEDFPLPTGPRVGAPAGGYRDRGWTW